MTSTLTPPEAELPLAPADQTPANQGEALARPYRLGVVGLGVAIGLFARLAVANGFSSLDSRSIILAAAATSLVVGLGLGAMAAERDRFGPSLASIAVVTGLSWGALNWISPPFGESVTVWSNRDQAVLAILGIGNGLLLAGLIALALVRRGPTLTVAMTLLAGVAVLAANTVLLREEWPAIISLGAAFALVLFAWDRSPRREQKFVQPEDAPRVSRAALSFISVALCGTALQLWLSRTDIPRSLPAVAICGLLIIAAFASMIRVRREIERRETTLSEWRSWMREIRTNAFRAEIETFESGAAEGSLDGPTSVGVDGEAPRALSFPNLVVTETTAPFDPVVAAPAAELPPIDLPTAQVAAPAAELPPIDLPTAQGAAPAAELPPIDLPTPQPAAPAPLPRIDLAPVASNDSTPSPVQAPEPAGTFSSMLAGVDAAPVPGVEVAGLELLDQWLRSPVASARTQSLLVAVEALSLDEFESLPPEDAAVAREEIGRYLADTMPDADMVSWIDGPYFIVSYASKPVRELQALNKTLQSTLKSTNGIHAFLRPGLNTSISDIVDEAVIGILQARQQQVLTN